jgi:steroid delta-isomerase-like uncharacterized protein
MSASNKAMVQHLFDDGLNDHDIPLMMELLSHCTFHMPLVGELKNEALREFFSSLLAAFPDIHRTMTEIVTDDIHVVVTRWIVTGTHLGPFMGVAPTGNRINVSGISMYRINSGEIVDEWLEWDSLGLMQQLGVVPSFQHEVTAA